MEIVQILKKSWHNVWGYRALWVFGVVLSLTTTSLITPFYVVFDGDKEPQDNVKAIEVVLPNSGRIIVPGYVSQDDVSGRIVIIYQGNIPDYAPRAGDILFHYDSPSKIAFTLMGSDSKGRLVYEKHVISPKLLYSIYVVLVVLLGFTLLYTALSWIARYVSTSALIQMVDREAESCVRVGILQGLRLGWSRSAWRLFLIDLALKFVAFAACIGLLFMVALPLTLTIPGGGWQIIIGSILTSGLFFLAILIALVGSALLYLVRMIVQRACVLEGEGVFAAIQSGIRTIKTNIANVGMTWLVWFGVGVIWPILMLPVVLLLFGLGIFFSGLPGVFAGWITMLTATGEILPVISGLIVGMTLFILTLLLPLAYLDGLREIFISSMWTLAYRRMRAGEMEQRNTAAEAPGPIKSAQVA